jgi:hypothetical protein
VPLDLRQDNTPKCDFKTFLMANTSTKIFT